MGCTPWPWPCPSIPLCSQMRVGDLFFLQPNYRIGDPILHIELRRWADIVLIAPCSANTLAKIATGVCDNLVVSQTSLFIHRLPPPVPIHSYLSLSRHITLQYNIPFLVLLETKMKNERMYATIRHRCYARWRPQRRRMFTRP